MPRFDVSPAAPHELLPACRLLFSAPHAEQSRARLLSAGADSGVFVARTGGRLRAAALAQALPGAVGVTCPPRGDSPEAEDAVVAAACAWLRERGVKVCQAFADADEIGAAAALERSGFRHVTQLAFLRRDVAPNEAAVREPAPALTFTHAAPPFSGDFATALLATHEDTRDCPELNAPRTPAELLAGFASSRGTAYLARCGDECAGVLTFEVGVESNEGELTYLGVVPSARGRGLGAELLRFGIAQVATARACAFNVSVDVRNAPALKLYTKYGFAESDRREVWLATWPA